jgi:conjugal transfer pilus assembly protein TraW
MWSSDSSPSLARAKHRTALPIAGVIVAFALILALPLAQATPEADLGAIGPLYPVAEPDMLRMIEAKLREKERSGELSRLQREAAARAEASIREPRPVEGITRATESRTTYLDPSVTASGNVVAPDGSRVVSAGQRVNPLDHVALSHWLLFFDARDAEQVRHAATLLETYRGRLKPILVGGSFVAVARAWRRPVYYDQGGALVRRFGIRYVPALVSQEGKRLRIDELVL